jgi:hypothetical protein
MLYTLALVTVTVFILKVIRDNRNYNQRVLSFLDSIIDGPPRNIIIPGPSGLPLVGCLNEVSTTELALDFTHHSVWFKSGHIQKLAEWFREYGDVIRVPLGQREAVRSSLLLWIRG